MRFLASLLATIASILLIVCIFISSVQFFVMDREYFAKQYRLMETSKTVHIPFSSLMDVTDVVLDYLADKNDDMDVKAKVNGKTRHVFTERELDHMRDVKGLYQGAVKLRNMAILVALAFYLIAALMLRNDRISVYAKGYLRGFIIVFAILLAAVAWMLIDFNSFWNSFHMLFFRNDLWQLDPNKSVMINMYPQEFWAELCKNIAIAVGAICGAILAASATYLGVKSYRRKSLLRLNEQGDDRT